jgi:hypothetical protein
VARRSGRRSLRESVQACRGRVSVVAGPASPQGDSSQHRSAPCADGESTGANARFDPSARLLGRFIVADLVEKVGVERLLARLDGHVTAPRDQPLCVRRSARPRPSGPRPVLAPTCRRDQPRAVDPAEDRGRLHTGSTPLRRTDRLVDRFRRRVHPSRAEPHGLTTQQRSDHPVQGQTADPPVRRPTSPRSCGHGGDHQGDRGDAHSALTCRLPETGPNSTDSQRQPQAAGVAPHERVDSAGWGGGIAGTARG